MMKNPYGMAGIMIAVLAIAIAVFQDDLREQFFTQQETTPETIIEKGLDLIGIGDGGSEEKRDKVMIAYSILGLLALVLGVVGYIRKESHRMAGVAGALAVVAIGWHYVLIGLVVAVAIFLLANLDIG